MNHFLLTICWKTALAASAPQLPNAAECLPDPCFGTAASLLTSPELTGLAPLLLLLLVPLLLAAPAPVSCLRLAKLVGPSGSWLSELAAPAYSIAQYQVQVQNVEC